MKDRTKQIWVDLGMMVFIVVLFMTIFSRLAPGAEADAESSRKLKHPPVLRV